MDIGISIETSEGSIGFGWECNNITEDDWIEHINEGIGDSFWENYYEFEDIVERAERDCPIRESGFCDEDSYKEAISIWMKEFFESKITPISVYYTIDDKSASLNLGYDIED